MIRAGDWVLVVRDIRFGNGRVVPKGSIVLVTLPGMCLGFRYDFGGGESTYFTLSSYVREL